MALDPSSAPEAGRQSELHVRFYAPLPAEGEAGRESELHVRFYAPDRAIAEIAARQHGVIGLHQLTAVGLSARAVQARAAAGRLHRVHQGVYSLTPRALLDRRGLWKAAVLACGPDAGLSHRSAAALHGLRPSGGTAVDVTVPGRSRSHHPGVFVHRSTTLSLADVTTVDGIPCTTVARTLLDLGDVVERRALERACDQAEVLELFDRHAVIDQADRNPRRRGASLLKAILDEHAIGRTLTASETEERFLAITRAAGLPTPEVNALLALPDGEPAIRVDFLWRERRLAVETDGRTYHRSPQAFERDRRRDQRLTAARWRPARFTHRQIELAPAEVRQTLRRLYDA